MIFLYLSLAAFAIAFGIYLYNVGVFNGRVEEQNKMADYLQSVLIEYERQKKNNEWK